MVTVLVSMIVAGCDGKSAGADTGGSVARGARLLDQYQCGTCHAIPGVPGARGVIGPPLNDFGRRSYIAGQIPNRADLLAQWIVDPRNMIPATTMPSMGVSPDDARDMAAYLHSLQ